jgi:hypothetical protein
MKTDVQFRIFKGNVIAVFPYIIETCTNVLSYEHVGQHSECVWNINQCSKPANEDQYTALKKELESIGYDLNIIKKRNNKTYLKAYSQTKNN